MPVRTLIDNDGQNVVEVVGFFEPQHQDSGLARNGNLHFIRHVESSPTDPVLLGHEDLYHLLDGRPSSRVQILVMPDVVVQKRAPAARKRLREQPHPSLVSEPREDHGYFSGESFALCMVVEVPALRTGFSFRPWRLFRLLLIALD